MHTHLPLFSKIDLPNIKSQLDELLQQQRQQIAILLQQNSFTWQNLIEPLEQLHNTLQQFWSPISHLKSVMNNPELRQVYNDCLPALSEFSTEMGQNIALYQAYQQLKDKEYSTLDTAQRKVVDNALRDFTLSGVNLPANDKQRYQQLQQELSRLTTTFEDHLLDATDAWSYPVSDIAQLAGLPEHAIQTARAKAEEKQLPGYLLNLEFPCYLAVMTYADNRALREIVYRAYTTRASELSDDGRYDNTAIINQLLALRLQKANLIGFPTYADYSLATKMAKTPQVVLDFLQQLANISKPQAQQELQALTQFANAIDPSMDLQPWDIAYFSEKLQQQQFNIAEEELRPYFPQPRVLMGMFEIIHRLYGMSVHELSGIDTWHPDVKVFQITDETGQARGIFYIDLYARANKRSGAWMDDYCIRLRTPQSLQLPVAYLTCNFTAPLGDQPALLTHQEVVTLFHEFGHTLHHLLTQIDYTDVAGINGVPWDAVEFPSQFFENWCWREESITLISAHYISGEPLPSEKLQQLLAAKNFQSAMQMVRQLEFALYDFRLYYEYDPARDDQLFTILQAVRNEVAVIQPPSWNRFQHSFAHIFAGGYSAGYYSYKWAEVLAADAFERFLQEGIFNEKTGRDYLHHILEQGGSRDPLELFIAFRGREPQVSALLTQCGIG